jgi:hypothetical protein
MARPLTLAGIGRAALFATLAAGGLASLPVALAHGWRVGLLCLLATAALAAASLPILLDSRREIFDPMWFVALTVGVGVTGKAFFLVYGPTDRVQFLLLGKEPGDLVSTALVVTIALLCLSGGYLLGSFRWRAAGLERLASEDWGHRRSVTVLAVLLGIGLLSFALFAARLDLRIDSLIDLSSKRGTRLPSGELLFSDGYLRWGALLTEIAFYLAFARWAAGQPKLRSLHGMTILLLGLLAIAFPIFVNVRLTVLLLIVRALLIWACLRSEPRLRYVLALLLVGFVIIGSMLAVRREQTSLAGFRSHLGIGEMLEVTVGSRHFLDLTKTAHVLDAVPERVPYQYGRTMLTWLLAPVPRVLWPDKPDIGVGRSLGVPVFLRRLGTGGVPPGIIGELYLNFGFAGVFIGMLVIGLVLRSLRETLLPFFPSQGMVLIYALLSTRLTLDLLTNSVSGGLAKLLQEMVPLLLALYALGGASTRSARPAPAAPDTALQQRARRSG